MSNIPSARNATGIMQGPVDPGSRGWHAHVIAAMAPVPDMTSMYVTRVGEGRTAKAAAAGGVTAKAAAVGVSLDHSYLGIPLSLRPSNGLLYLSCSDCASRGVEGFHQDDASGRQRWIIREVRDSPGEYNIMVSGGRAWCSDNSDGWYLSAPATGRDVDLWYRDDASGRQRWVFRQVGNLDYTLRLAGGRADDAVFLGIEGNGTRVKLFDSDKAPRCHWRMEAVGGGPRPGPSTPLPPAIVPVLTRMTGLAEHQIDVVQQLISLPENSTPQWHKNYGFIEFLGDGRGFTATIFGACSGTGDLAMIFDELAAIPGRSAACSDLLKYHAVLKRKRGDDIAGIEPIKTLIRALGDDASWKTAVWRVYSKLYWRFAMDWAEKKGACAGRPGPPLALAASRGFMVDTAVNHGASKDSFMNIVNRMNNKDTGDEIVWVTSFADAREKMLKSGFQDLDTSRTGDRCRLWKDLVRRNTALSTPFQALAGYWGKYTIQ